MLWAGSLFFFVLLLFTLLFSSIQPNKSIQIPSGQLIDMITAGQPSEDICRFIETSHQSGANICPVWAIPSLLAAIDRKKGLEVFTCLRDSGYLKSKIEMQYYVVADSLEFLAPHIGPIDRFDDRIRMAIFDLTSASLLGILLDHGLDPLLRSWSKRKNLLLSHAVLEAHDTRLAERLVDGGANVNYKSPYDTDTPLTMALHYANLPLARLLFLNGASILSIACRTTQDSVLLALVYPIFRLMKLSSVLGTLPLELLALIIGRIITSPHDL